MSQSDPIDSGTDVLNTSATLVCSFVGWLVCREDYTKTTLRTFIKLVWRNGLGPEWTLLTFSADPDKGTDLELFYLTLFNIGG